MGGEVGARGVWMVYVRERESPRKTIRDGHLSGHDTDRAN